MSAGQTQQSISRREVLRRGAALGAAVTVAAPLVQGLGTVGAFAAVSPPPIDPEPGVSYVSNLQVLYTKNGSVTRFGIKYEPGGGWDNIGRGVACWAPDSFENGSGDRSHFEGTVTAYVEGGKGVLAFQPPPPATGIEVVEVRAHDGQASGGAPRCTAAITPTDGVYRVAKP